MERDIELHDVIDLGVASTLTQGPGDVRIDEALGQFGLGIADE